jgi:ABC-type arginine/histidine transport system permease subunit
MQLVSCHRNCAALLYLALVETVRRVWNRAEARLTRHLVMR